MLLICLMLPYVFLVVHVLSVVVMINACVKFFLKFSAYKNLVVSKPTLANTIASKTTIDSKKSMDIPVVAKIRTSKTVSAFTKIKETTSRIWQQWLERNPTYKWTPKKVYPINSNHTEPSSATLTAVSSSAIAGDSTNP